MPRLLPNAKPPLVSSGMKVTQSQPCFAMAASGAAFAVLLPLHMIDNLWNAMLNPIYVLLMGAMMGLGAKAATRPQAQPRGFPVAPFPPSRPMNQPLAA